MKHGRLAHVRSQFSLFRRSPTHKNLPPATFCTSERVFAVLFARRKKYQSVLPCRELRGFPNLESAHPNNALPRTKLNPFETFRFAESLSLSGRHTPCAIFAASRLLPAASRLFGCLRQPCSPLRLPPHGRLAHVRSQFSLFRRSPTHKNLPQATFCTSEQYPSGGTRSVRLLLDLRLGSKRRNADIGLARIEKQLGHTVRLVKRVR